MGLVNRFDSTEKPNYVSTYVPAPLEYLAGIAKNMQGDYDKGVSATEPFNKISAAIKASPVGEGIKQNLIGSFNKEKEDLYNSTQSYSSPEFQKKAMDLVNKYANDPRISYLASEKELFDKNQAESLKDENSRNLDYTYKKDEKGNFIQAKSIEELPLSAKITKYEDAYKAQSDIMGNIASSMSGGSKGYDFSHPQSGIGPGGEYYAFNKTTSQVEEVSPETVKNIALNSLPLYAKTNAGTFELQKEARKYIGDKAYGLDYDKLSQLSQQDAGYAALKETIDSKFSNDLLSVGQKQIFTKSKYDVDNMTLSDRQTQGANDKLAQEASTTPEILSLRDNGDLQKVMPDNLKKFYNKNDLDLSNNVQTGSKEAGDRIAQSGGWLNLDLGPSGKSNNEQKNTIEYVNSLYDSTSKILGISKKEAANLYNQHNEKNKLNKSEPNGYSWLKGLVENYYGNLTLQKNTVATLQVNEQATATDFFLGQSVNKGESDSSIGSNIKKGEVTDLDGNMITDLESINPNNYIVTSIGFEKPGQVVLAGNNGQQLLMNTNLETFKKITKPIVNIVNGGNSFKQTFELNDDQKQRLNSKTPTTSTLDIDGNKISKTTFDKQQFNIGDKVYKIESFLIRENNNIPTEHHYIIEQDTKTGKSIENTLDENELKVKFSNELINSPEFRGLNNQKQNKVIFK